MKKMMLAVVLTLSTLVGSAKTTNSIYSYTDNVKNTSVNSESVQSYLEQVRKIKSRKQLLRLMYTLESSDNMSMLPQEYYTHPHGKQLVLVNSIKRLNKDFFKKIGYSEEEAEQKMQSEWNLEQRIGTNPRNQMAARDEVLAEANLEDLRSYVELQIIRAYSGVLSNA